MLYKYWEQENYLIDYLLLDFLLDMGYNIMPSVKETIDNLPETNPERNKLWQLINLPYDAQQYNSITKRTWLFKLSYKTKVKKSINGKITFFGHLNEISNGQS